MQVWVYSIMRDEMAILPWWLRHYASIADRMVIYDDGSQDGTPDLVRKMGGEVYPLPLNGPFDDVERVEFANQVARQARGQADWVIWVDGDEFLYHPQLRAMLEQMRGQVVIPRVDGYSMVVDSLPDSEDASQLYQLAPMGLRDTLYDKPCLVDPAVDFTWQAGKHEMNFAGSRGWGWQEEPLRLLHYRFFGREYWAARNARNYARLSSRNLEGRYGHLTYPGYRGVNDADWFSSVPVQDVVHEGALR